ncbi:MAG: hypothetical protein M1823_001296 [Watsoniomyces obsoletus]|nr:MAG: hypothetical protein M1823_001296 [Watsoniomyces obsoletus]
MQRSPAGVTDTRASTRLNSRSVLRPTTPEPVLLQEANRTMKRKLIRDEVLSSPTREYIAQLADSTERIQAQLAVAQKELLDRDMLISSRKRRKSGKRLVIEGQVVLTTTQIRDRVQAAEAEAASKKRAKKPRNGVQPSPRVVEPQELEGSEPEIE